MRWGGDNLCGVDPHVTGDRARAAVLEGHLGRDLEVIGVSVQGVDQHRVFFGDETAPDLARARELAVVGVELLMQYQVPLDLRPGELRVPFGDSVAVTEDGYLSFTPFPQTIPQA